MTSPSLWIPPLATYLCASLVVLMPLTQGEFSQIITLLLYGLAIVVLLSHISDVIQPDLLEGHLAWLLSHGTLPSAYFLQQMGQGLRQLVLPLTLAFSGIHLFVYSTLSLGFLILSFFLTCLTMLGWGIILSLSQGKQSQSFITMAVAPLAIPNLLIAEAIISTIAVHGDPVYYIGMQGGLMLVSLGLCGGLASLVIRNLEW